jgi:hypothetical protein
MVYIVILQIAVVPVFLTQVPPLVDTKLRATVATVVGLAVAGFLFVAADIHGGIPEHHVVIH